MRASVGHATAQGMSHASCKLAAVAYPSAINSGPLPYIDGLILQVTQRIGSLEVRHDERQAGASAINARYHVLGGTLSPLDGIGPGELTIDALVTIEPLGLSVNAHVLAVTLSPLNSRFLPEKPSRTCPTTAIIAPMNSARFW